MKLFTIITDWQGGTYVQQVQAENQLAAIINWAQMPDISLVIAKEIIVQQLLAEIVVGKEEPVLLTGLRNAWCISFLIEDSAMILHIICTEKIV